MAAEEVAVLLQNDTLPCNPFWVPNIHESMVNFESMRDGNSTDASQLLHQSVKEELEDDEFDPCINPRGKKRRLSATQVQFLEKHFEVENKLEPERKVQLAKEIGLQPRQVAIWFQNRRARFKNKQLERDYSSLKSSYDKLKLDYENLLKEKENLNNQFVALKEKLDVREGKAEALVTEKTASPKMEDVATSSAKSDVFDSDSPHSYLDPVDSCQVFESEFSQDEEDEFSRNLLPEQYYTKAYHEPPASGGGFEFSGEDPPFWAWSF